MNKKFVIRSCRREKKIRTRNCRRKFIKNLLPEKRVKETTMI